MHFYELHEGDNEVYSDLLLAHEAEYEPEEFFELVQAIRRRVQDSFEHDTLIEAIAAELEREHDFIAITDDRLEAAVNVSTREDDNFLARIELDDDEDDDDVDDEDDDELDRDADYVTITAEFDPDAPRRPN
ncbi:MAG TPA: hypothetical protein VH723_08540 [Candidatus Limnocylindrales bacterium]